MRILADENIPYVREAFASLGKVETCSGRDMTQERVKDKDVLLVRSITKVNADLLSGSAVQFVATATIGEDHIDKAWLAEQGIGFASAPGSNANSVAEYITAALLLAAQRYGCPLAGQTLGIVGVGNVGSRVAQKAAALGMTCVLNDPPLARTTNDPKYRPIDEVLACDFVTLHVPLTRSGPDATHHLVDAPFLDALKPGAILMNTSRGAVVDTAALKHALDTGRLRAAVLDVWENEPHIDIDLLERVFIGTPHIAGYSFDGKVNGTRQIYEAVCAHAGVEPTWDPAPHLPPPECPRLRLRGDTSDYWGTLRAAVLGVYDLRRDAAALRKLRHIPEANRGNHFDRLRKHYPRRREFHNTAVIVDPPNEALEWTLAGLGFRIEGGN